MHEIYGDGVRFGPPGRFRLRKGGGQKELKSGVTPDFYSYCPPPFQRKAEGLSFCLSVFPSVRPPIEVGTLLAQLLLQFYTDSFETSLVLWSWSEDMHVVLI